MRILLIDDHPLFARGLTFFLAELEPDIECVVASTVDSALTQPGPFTLVLLDLKLPGVAGFNGLAQVGATFEDASIVVLSGEDQHHVIRACIDAGAAGFVPKSSTPQVLLAALRLILAGGCYLPPQILESPAPQPSPWPAREQRTDTQGHWHAQIGLTQRQLDVLRQAIKGKSNKLIARDLDVSEGTVKAHLSIAYRLIGAANRTEAVYRVAQLDAVDLAS